MKNILAVLTLLGLSIACEDTAQISSANASSGDCCLESVSPENVTEAEIESLLFMVEEEKLARDVYLTLYSVWGISSFYTISASEQQHMDAVQNLLKEYQQEVPETLESMGEFTNVELQQLFDDLTALGNQSTIDALLVGALIEEVDIIDLDEIRATVVHEAPIDQVYAQLRSGSENHLRAFVKNLVNQGVTYEPQFLDEAVYLAIVN